MTSSCPASQPPILVRTLDKHALQAAPPAELAMLFAAGHICNEVNALLRVAVWASLGSPSQVAQKQAQAFLTNFFLRLLAGKLNEAHEAVRKAYFSTALSQKYDPLLRPEALEALQYLKRYFSSTNNSNKIRNLFAFHYSPERLAAALPLVEDDLVIYMQKGHAANNLFLFAEAAATHALFQETGADEAAAIPALVTELTSLAANFATFFDGLMDAILRSIGSEVWGPPAQPIDLVQLLPFDSIQLPYFADLSSFLSRAP